MLRRVLAATREDEARTVKDIGAESGLGAARRTTALNLLEQGGAVRTDDRSLFLRTGLPTDDAVERGVQLAERRRRIVSSRIDPDAFLRGDDRLQAADAAGLRRGAGRGPCGYCDSCDAATSTVRKWTDEAGRTDGGTMDHPEFGTGTVMSSEPDRVTVLFAEHGYETLSLAAVREETTCSRRPTEARPPHRGAPDVLAQELLVAAAVDEVHLDLIRSIGSARRWWYRCWCAAAASGR